MAWCFEHGNDPARSVNTEHFLSSLATASFSRRTSIPGVREMNMSGTVQMFCGLDSCGVCGGTIDTHGNSKQTNKQTNNDKK